MAKTELEVRFTLPLDEVLLKHKVDAEHKAKEAFVLELLRQGDISAGRAARLLNTSRWDLLELMYESGISPFDDPLAAEALDDEVKSALKDFDEPTLSAAINHQVGYLKVLHLKQVLRLMKINVIIYKRVVN